MDTTSNDKAKLRNFGVAFLQLVDDFGNRNYLCEHFGSSCGDGFPTYYDNEKIQKKLFLECGEIKWPTQNNELPEDLTTVVKLVEFIFRFVSKPTESWYHDWCGSEHPKAYAFTPARYEYTIAINKLFPNFGLPLHLKKGRILRASVPILDKFISDELHIPSDSHLENLIRSAINDFQQGDRKSRQHALRTIVDAFERTKSIKDTDKKKSVQQIVAGLSMDDEVQKAMDEDMRRLTQIGNSFCIRHHEIDKIPVEDDDMIEFLFYLYFNYVKFILKKHSYITSTQD